jgi:protein-S-isoprenylcysteine O-methyltransferase Ste14
MQNQTKENLGYIINGLTIALYFFMLFNVDVPPELAFLQYGGWILFTAGIALIILSFVALLGPHPKPVIEHGILSVVRNPMYLGSIFVYLAMAFFMPHWIMVTISVVNALIIYWFMFLEEQVNLEKFGDDYARYMQSVPRANLFTGFIRLTHNKRTEK